MVGFNAAIGVQLHAGVTLTIEQQCALSSELQKLLTAYLLRTQPFAEVLLVSDVFTMPVSD